MSHKILVEEELLKTFAKTKEVKTVLVQDRFYRRNI